MTSKLHFLHNKRNNNVTVLLSWEIGKRPELSESPTKSDALETERKSMAYQH